MTSSADKTIDYSYKNAPDCTDLNHLPGNFGLPFIGHMTGFVKDLRGLVNQHLQRYGPISKMNIMGNKGLLVADPDFFKEVLLDQNKNFSNEMGYRNNLAKFFDGGLLLRDFDEHKVQRRIFQTAFKNEAMRTYVAQMNQIMSDDMDSWQGVNKFVFYPHIKNTLLTTAAKTFVGIDRNDPGFKRLYTNYVNMLDGTTALVQAEIPGSKWRKAKVAQRDIYEYFRSQIPARRNGEGTDFLSFFCREKTEDGQYFSEEDIIRHMNFLVFAAHDTTTASILNILFELAKNPTYQHHLRKVCQDFYDATGKDALDYDDMNAIDELEYVMLEGQRLHPSVPITARRTIREMTLAGQRIPANTLLWMPIFSHYRSDTWWSNPEQFDPERFSPERTEQKAHSFIFAPFGGGAHKCIGMHFAKIQVKCFLYQFLRRYEFSVPDNYDPWLMMIPMPRPADGLPLTLKRIP